MSLLAWGKAFALSNLWRKGRKVFRRTTAVLLSTKSLMTAGSPKFDGVQVLRALAALLVVVEHAFAALTDKAGFTLAYQPFAWAGGFGVYLFFAISGFVMAHTTSEQFQSPGAPQRFLMRRIWRILPLYWLATGIYALKLLIEGNPPSAQNLVQSLFFIPYFDASFEFRPVLGLGWTMNFEMLFYLFFALALVFPRKIGLVFVSAALGTLVFLGEVLGWQAPKTDDLGTTLFAFLSDPAILFFLVGIGVWIVMKTWGAPEQRPFLTWGVIAVLGAAGIAILQSGDTAVLGATVYLLVGVVLLLALGAIPHSGKSTIREIAILLGDASYSIYLSHSFVTGPAGRIWALIGAPNHMWPLFIVGTTVICAVVGVAVHIWVERPLLHLLKPLFSMRSPKPAIV